MDVYDNKGNGVVYSKITGGSVISANNGISGYDANENYDKDGFSYCNIEGGIVTAKGNSSQGLWYCDIANADVYAYDNVQPGIWGSTIKSGTVHVYNNGTDGLSNRTSGIYASIIQGGTIYTYDNCPYLEGGTVDSIGIDNSLIGKKKSKNLNYASNAVIVSSGNNVGIKNSYINGGTISLIDNNTKRNVTGDTVSRSIIGSTVSNSSITIMATHTLSNNKVGLSAADNNIFDGGNNIWIIGFEYSRYKIDDR